MIKAIVFDFDGTIVPSSESLKRDLLDVMFPGMAEDVDDAYTTVMSTKGSRFDIIRIILKRRGIPDSEMEGQVDSYAEDYNTHVQKAIKGAGVSKETRETLDTLRPRYPIFINTGTPLPFIKQTLTTLGILEWFTDIYEAFSAEEKADKLRTIAEKIKATPDQLFFVGDGKRDREAARQFGCHFVGIANVSNKWIPSMGGEYPIVDDLKDIIGIINRT